MTSMSCLILLQKASMCDMIASSSVRGTPCPWMSASNDEIPFFGEDPVSLEVPLCSPCLDLELGDNCIQIFHLGRYIVGYTVGNFVLRRRVSGAVKHNFRPYIRRYTSPNEKFEYGYPHSNVLSNFTRQKLTV